LTSSSQRHHRLTAQAFHIYTLGTSAYFALQSLPLLLTPKLIVSLLATEARTITDLETYLCRTLALVLLSFAASIILLSGHVPLSNQLSAPISKAQEENGDGNIKDPYAFPVLVITTTYHAFTSFYLYTQNTWGGFSFGFGSGLVLSAVLTMLGGWVMMFGSEKGRISKSTGADKRTSSFPFSNAESASSKKKEKERESKRKSLSSKSR
jgi:hypothetical protein